MKAYMKLLTIGVLMAFVVGTCGCTAPSSANNAGPITTNATAQVKTAQVKTIKTPTASSVPSAPVPAYVRAPAPEATPVTGSFDQKTYLMANGTVITATVSNSPANVGIGLSPNNSPLPMHSLGGGRYTFTLEGVIRLRGTGPGHGVITLWDNSKQINTATTTWANP
jgi:hypothetical protein